MIYVVGHTAFDHICRVSSFPPPNGSATILDRRVYFGGGAANIAVGISRLGEPCTLVSAVGGDFTGGEYDRWMKEAGVVQQFFVVPEANTPTAFMFTDGRGDQMTFFEWGASAVFARAEAPEVPFVHMATADPDFNVRVARKAGWASFDPGQDLHRYQENQLRTILSCIDVLFANRHEVEGMCRIMNIGQEELVAMVPMAVFTRGAEGSTLYSDSGEVSIPAVPVRMADPTGAGDAYRAGFLAAHCRGFEPLECCRLGTVMASFVVEAAGCQTNLPRWADVAARYKRHFGAPVADPGRKC